MSRGKVGRQSKAPKNKKFIDEKRSAESADGFSPPTKKKRSDTLTESPKFEKKTHKPLKSILKSPKKDSENAETPNADVADRPRNFRVGKNAQQKLDTMSRKDRKIYLRKLQAKRKPNFELSQKAKQIWEKLRNSKISKSTKTDLSNELFSLVEGKAKELIFAHDTVRIFQCLMALKNEEIRTKLFEELKGEILNMSKKKYSKYFVIKMLKYGTPSQRTEIMKSFSGHVPDLVKHAVASDVIEYAYNEYANALQRCHIVTEFYGPEYQMFKVETPITLKEILTKEPQKRDIILDALYNHLTAVAEKPLLKLTLLHHLMLEFLENCSDSKRIELIDSFKDRCVEMIHTRDGAFAGMHCLWYGTTKDKKAIMKSFKGLVTKTCSEEYGHLFILALFDSVDDTVSVGKLILKEIEKNLKDVVANKYGVKVVEYLLSPRDSRHFNKQIVQLLSMGDAKSDEKKHREKKYEELLAFISPGLLNFAAENVREMIFDPHSCLLLQLILEKAVGDKRNAYEELCKVLQDEFIPCNDEQMHLVEHAQGHFVLAHLLKLDKQLHEKGEVTLSEVIVETVPEENIASWLTCNKGAYTLVHMLESGVGKVGDKVLEIVEKSKKKLKRYSFSSAAILLRRLNEKLE